MARVAEFPGGDREYRVWRELMTPQLDRVHRGICGLNGCEKKLYGATANELERAWLIHVDREHPGAQSPVIELVRDGQALADRSRLP